MIAAVHPLTLWSLFIIRTRTHTAKNGSLYVTPSGREPAGGGQGPPEDALESWPDILSCERGLVADMPASGRADDASGAAQFHDASHGD
ncbi:MAG: hypothetical protein OXC62_03970 [Aestuariivita sp.]|nr:hypothetical protein [Aestuariivita sp.]